MLDSIKKKFASLMVDPSILTSDKHVEAIIEYSDRVLVPATLSELISQSMDRRNSNIDELFETVRFFTWPWTRPDLARKISLLRERMTPYRAKEEYVREILPAVEKTRLPGRVKGILKEEYSFMRESSALLMRFRKTAEQLRKWGVPTLDTGKKFIEIKQDVLGKLKGPRWIIGLLMEGAAIFPEDPSWRPILGFSGMILLILDP